MSYPLNACIFTYYLCMCCYRHYCAFLFRCTERICSLCMRPPYTSCRANSFLKRVILSFLMTWAILLICVCVGYWAFVLGIWRVALILGVSFWNTGGVLLSLRSLSGRILERGARICDGIGVDHGFSESYAKKKTRSSSPDILTSKKGPRDYYKGKNCKSTGFHTRKGT